MFLASAFLAVLLAGTGETPAPFRDVTFDQALTTAQADKRIVLIDFFTTWCVPCKKLDATTWKDADVVKWIDTKCVALKIDAEKQVDLAKRFHVDGYPTMILLRADGTEIDRFVGYRDAKKFLSDVDAALAGRDVVTRAKEALVGHENDAMARQAYGDALKQKGRYDDALTEYLWCFDHGRESAGYAGVRLSFLLNDIASMTKSFPAAQKALEERRDAAEARLVAGPATFEDASDAVALNRTLRDSKRTLALYEQMIKAGPLSKSIKPVFARELLKPFLEAKRYPEMLALVEDPAAQVERAIQMFEISSPKSEEADEATRKDMEEARSMMRPMVVEQGCQLHEALLATRKVEAAGKIADRLIEFSPTGATYVSLIRSSNRAGDSATADALTARALSSLPEKEGAVVRRAAKRADESKKAEAK
jgi:thioredoxin-like negative regulator of GroEL